MLGCGGGAIDLFGGVKDFEREDGEAVDHQAGSFRVQRQIGVQRGKRGEQIAVDALGEVVAELIELVDGALAGGDGLVAGERIAGGVFAMPEIEVGAMLVEHELIKVRGGSWARSGGIVPEARGLVVQEDNVRG